MCLYIYIYEHAYIRIYTHVYLRDGQLRDWCAEPQSHTQDLWGLGAAVRDGCGILIDSVVGMPMSLF